MRNNAKTCENNKKILKFCEILRNIVIICKKLPPATPEGIIRYKLGTGLHFLFVLFRNISQYILKYFEISFEIFRKKCIPKSFERLRFFRKISHRSQFFRKIFGMQFLSKDFVYLFADVTQTQYCI